MMLYYNKPTKESEEANIFIDFASIHNRVQHTFSESKLLRLLHKRCNSSMRYQNRYLYPLKEIMDIPEIYIEFKTNE